jgi:hypothetical protein
MIDSQSIIINIITTTIIPQELGLDTPVSQSSMWKQLL